MQSTGRVVPDAVAGTGIESIGIAQLGYEFAALLEEGRLPLRFLF